MQCKFCGHKTRLESDQDGQKTRLQKDGNQKFFICPECGLKNYTEFDDEYFFYS